MKNHLILTKYAYPIDKSHLKTFFNGIYFDNPRTNEEIKYVATILKKLNMKEIRLPEEQYQVGEGYITLRMLAEEFLRNYCNDNVVNNFYQKHGKEKNIYKLLAKMWVIVRCDTVLDEEQLKGLFTIKINTDSFNSPAHQKKIKDIELPPNYNLVNEEQIFKYLNFISFMLNPNEIYSSLLINNKYGILENNIGMELFPLLMQTFMTKTSYLKEFPYCTFDHIMKGIMRIVTLVGDRFNTYKFKHICKVINGLNYSDSDSTLLSLISIIEMLLTHNSENSRFNVDESITRQFIHKTTFLLYENDNTINLQKTKDELKLAYQLRSDITHGNFENMNTTLKKLHKFYNLNENGQGIDYDSLESSVSYLNESITKYVKVILKVYLIDETKLEIIKAV